MGPRSIDRGKLLLTVPETCPAAAFNRVRLGRKDRSTLHSDATGFLGGLSRSFTATGNVKKNLLTTQPSSPILHLGLADVDALASPAGVRGGRHSVLSYHHGRQRKTPERKLVFRRRRDMCARPAEHLVGCCERWRLARRIRSCIARARKLTPSSDYGDMIADRLGKRSRSRT